MRLACRIDAKTRAAVEAFARRRGLSLSDAVRTLVVLGGGGSETDARVLNAEMAAAKARAREGLPRAYDGPSGDGAKRGTRRLEVRLPRRHAPPSGLKKAVAAGLARVL